MERASSSGGVIERDAKLHQAWPVFDDELEILENWRGWSQGAKKDLGIYASFVHAHVETGSEAPRF